MISEFTVVLLLGVFVKPPLFKEKGSFAHKSPEVPV